MKIIDSHCHIYPDKISAKASLATGKFYNLPASMDGSVSALLEEGKKAGIGHFVVNSVATTPKQVHAINTFIAETVAGGAGLFTGLGTLHPDSADPEADVNEIVSLGLRGIKLHPDIQKFATDSPGAMTLFELADKAHLPVLVHLGDKRYDYSNPNRIKPVLRAFPGLTMIGAHLGGWSVWESASLELYRFENLLVDTSSSLFALPPAKGCEIIRRYGADRTLFGTDYPLWFPTTEVKLFDELPLTDDEKEKIFYKNASGLYGINL